MAGVAFAVEGDGVGFATESYAASALYTTLANLSGAFWRIRRARFTNFLSHPLENHPAQIDTGKALFAHQNLPYFGNGRKLP
jgi:hypothetical protein